MGNALEVVLEDLCSDSIKENGWCFQRLPWKSKRMFSDPPEKMWSGAEHFWQEAIESFLFCLHSCLEFSHTQGCLFTWVSL